DTITGNAGDDTLFGGEGIDISVFNGATAAYQFSVASDGRLIISGTDGMDTLDGVETLRFTDGDIQVAKDGVTGLYTLTGGPNTDTIALFNGPTAAYLFSVASDGRLILSGTDGTDTLDGVETLRFTDGDIQVAKDYVTGLYTLTGGTNTDTITIDPTSIEAFTIYGGAGDDLLTGGLGNDVISGGDGSDLFVVSGGSDLIDGGASNDTISFGNFSADSNVAIDLTLGKSDVTIVTKADAISVTPISQAEPFHVSFSSTQLTEMYTEGDNFTLTINENTISYTVPLGGASGSSVLDGLLNSSALSAIDDISILITDAVAGEKNLLVEGLNNSIIFDATLIKTSHTLEIIDAQQQINQTVQHGFEDSLSGGWQHFGNVNISDAALSYPTTGMYATLSASGTNQASLESSGGMNLGQLDQTGLGNATVGSMLNQTISLNSGQTFSFNWSFLDADYSPYNDFAFLSVNGDVSVLADAGSPESGSQNPWSTYEFTAPENGEYNISIGVLNVEDETPLYSSKIYIDNIGVVGSDVTNTISISEPMLSELTGGEILSLTIGSNVSTFTVPLSPTRMTLTNAVEEFLEQFILSANIDITSSVEDLGNGGINIVLSGSQDFMPQLQIEKTTEESIAFVVNEGLSVAVIELPTTDLNKDDLITVSINETPYTFQVLIEENLDENILQVVLTGLIEQINADAQLNVHAEQSGPSIILTAGRGVNIEATIKFDDAIIIAEQTFQSIENVEGSDGEDLIVGNAQDNVLAGGAADDTISGGTGTDTSVFNGPTAAYQFS
ncbi:hypothetical protein OAA86_10970, partial [Rhodospirillales bacterium]|nr:hypothetical protein [Rhodospirillales bacterium]